MDDGLSNNQGGVVSNMMVNNKQICTNGRVAVFGVMVKVAALAGLIGLAGCGQTASQTNTQSHVQGSTQNNAETTSRTAAQTASQVAREPVSGKSYLIDVRTEAEYAVEHVENALLMPYEDIVKLVKQQRITPNDEILLYCRSGNRAGQAKNMLEAAGFSHVQNLQTVKQAKSYKAQACNASKAQFC